MYLENIVIQNFGSIENLKILKKDLFYENDKPKLIVLVGENGSGKTMLLSSITDAFYEFANNSFSDILPKQGTEYSYYKVSGTLNRRIYSLYAFCFLEFANKIKKYEYFDKCGKINFSDCKKLTDNLLTIAQNLSENDNYKEITQTKDDINFQQDFSVNSYCCFPSDRFEYPHWLNQKSESKNVYFTDQIKLNNRLNKPILIRKSLEDIKRWILDVFLDSRVDLKITPDGVKVYNLKDILFLQKSKENIEEILSTILEKEVELQVNIRGQGYRLKVIDKSTQKDLIPSLDNLSAGQSTLLNIFASIIMLSDQNDPNKSINLEQINGIVLIDEIDLHLHIHLQKNALPKLLSKFPNVQFIVSSHSPFFLSGVSKEFGEKALLINMPSGNYLQRVDDFSEFDKAFDIFEKLTNENKKELDAIKEKIKTGTNPLIVTEGKTDWKHIKKSLEKFKSRGKFAELEIDFLEYGDDLQMGDDTVMRMCREYSKIDQARKIIFIFDHDNQKIINEHIHVGSFKNWGKNVYSFCIPKPNSRSKHNNISIEFYYSDQEIKTEDSGKRLYFTNELEKKVTQSLTDPKKHSIQISILQKPKQDEELNKKIFDEEVDEIIDKMGIKVIHSKSVFAENVYQSKAGFNNFNIENFILIFDVINGIVLT